MKRQPPIARENIPKWVLIVFALVFPLGLPAAAFIGHEAYVDSMKIEELTQRRKDAKKT